MAKIERKYMAHFINANIGQASGEAEYERLGQDLEEYSAEMNAQVNTTNNILGQKSITISSYDKSGSVEPYYADKDSPLFETLQEIIDGDLVLDNLKTDIVEVHLWETEQTGAYPAVKEECYWHGTSAGSCALPTAYISHRWGCLFGFQGSVKKIVEGRGKLTIFSKFCCRWRTPAV